jgi:hypothetical protein
MIAQGKGVRQWLDDALDSSRPATVDELLPLELVQSRDVTALLATFGHPSAPNRNNWGMNERQPYLLDTVKPTVELIRALTVRHDVGST